MKAEPATDEAPSQAVLTQIAWKLRGAGVPPENCDRDGLAYILRAILAKYEQHRGLLSRDTMPTGDELATGIKSVHEHLAAIAQLCADNVHIAVWLEEFAEKGQVRADAPDGVFLEAFCRCLHAARDADDHLSRAVQRGEALIINRPDSAVEHRRRTRTESRDTVLIPALVAWLRLCGLRLRDVEQADAERWDLEALDTACEIIELVLSDWRVAVPQSGDTGRGEKHQGRLRRMVKDAWNALPAAG